MTVIGSGALCCACNLALRGGRPQRRVLIVLPFLLEGLVFPFLQGFDSLGLPDPDPALPLYSCDSTVQKLLPFDNWSCTSPASGTLIYLSW